jgi:hypothetical protein
MVDLSGCGFSPNNCFNSYGRFIASSNCPEPPQYSFSADVDDIHWSRSNNNES